MGRYKLLRSFGAKLLENEPLDKICLRVQGKKIITRAEAEHIMERMALRSYLRTEEHSKEEVWSIYASRQAYRQRMHFLIQGRYKYMNVLFSGTIYPLLELPPLPLPSPLQTTVSTSPVSVATESKWINLSEEDIRTSSFGKEPPTASPVKRKVVYPEILVTCCYTCSSFVTKDSTWGVCRLARSPNGELCNEKFNLRIVCSRCHHEMGRETPSEYLLGRGSYRCAKGLAAKEYIVTLGRALIAYYELYRGIKHED